jgi:SAM-dependent methyltransferase
MHDGEDAYQWSPESVAKFWDRMCTLPNLQLFGEQRGKSLIKFVCSKIDLRGPCLDIGCGKGDILYYLSLRNIECQGTDISYESVVHTERRLAANPFFKGSHRMESLFLLPHDEGTFEGCFLIETVEHLFQNQVVPVLSEMRRVLRPRGKVIISCPYNEDLRAGSLICPNCQVVFHRWQHLGSYDEESMQRLAAEVGIRTLSCQKVFLRPSLKAVVLQLVRRSDSAYCPGCESFFPITHQTMASPKQRVAGLYKSLVFIGERV